MFPPLLNGGLFILLLIFVFFFLCFIFHLRTLLFTFFPNFLKGNASNAVLGMDAPSSNGRVTQIRSIIPMRTLYT